MATAPAPPYPPSPGGERAGFGLRLAAFLLDSLLYGLLSLVFVIPDAPWLSPEVRDMLDRHLDPPLELRK